MLEDVFELIMAHHQIMFFFKTTLQLCHGINHAIGLVEALNMGHHRLSPSHSVLILLKDLVEEVPVLARFRHNVAHHPT